AGVSFLIRLKRSDQGYVGRLAGGELKLAGLFEEKGHRLFGDFLAILELYSVWAHQPSSLQAEDWTIPMRKRENARPAPAGVRGSCRKTEPIPGLSGLKFLRACLSRNPNTTRLYILINFSPRAPQIGHVSGGLPNSMLPQTGHK